MNPNKLGEYLRDKYGGKLVELEAKDGELRNVLEDKRESLLEKGLRLLPWKESPNEIDFNGSGFKLENTSIDASRAFLYVISLFKSRGYDFRKDVVRRRYIFEREGEEVAVSLRTFPYDIFGRVGVSRDTSTSNYRHESEAEQQDIIANE